MPATVVSKVSYAAPHTKKPNRMTIDFALQAMILATSFQFWVMGKKHKVPIKRKNIIHARPMNKAQEYNKNPPQTVTVISEAPAAPKAAQNPVINATKLINKVKGKAI